MHRNNLLVCGCSHRLSLLLWHFLHLPLPLCFPALHKASMCVSVAPSYTAPCQLIRVLTDACVCQVPPCGASLLVGMKIWMGCVCGPVEGCILSIALQAQEKASAPLRTCSVAQVNYTSGDISLYKASIRGASVVITICLTAYLTLKTCVCVCLSWCCGIIYHKWCVFGIQSQKVYEAWWPAVVIRTQSVMIYGSRIMFKQKPVCQKLLSCPLWPTDTPDAPRKLAVSTQSLASGTMGSSQGAVQPLSQRKRLLRAPTLAELDSSESDVSVWWFMVREV